MSTSTGYLPGGARAVIHLPPGAVGRCGLVMVPPFGLEDVASYRGRRAWAIALAERGHPVLRLELPGTGDSAGSLLDAELFDRWVESVTGAARELRFSGGCPRVAVLGIGLGGTLGCLAAAAGDEIDDLALWAVPARGHSLIREMRAFAAVQGAMPATPQADGTSWFYGYPLSAAVAARLGAVDLATLSLRRDGRRALVFGRDGMSPDRRLVEAFRTAGIEPELASGDGYSSFVESPQTSKPPAGVYDTLAAWLAAAPPPPTATASGTLRRQRLAPRLELSADAVEEVVELPIDGGNLSAVIATPANPAPVTLLLLNAGGNRRTGPGRLSVDSARAAADAGVTAVRVDLLGIGDSDGPHDGYESDADYYTPEVEAQLPQLLSALEARGLPPRFVLTGLCSGAYWAVASAATDPRVVGAVAFNAGFLVWEQWRGDVGAAHDVRRLRRPSTWLRIVTGQASWRHARQVARALLHRALLSRGTRDSADRKQAALLDHLDRRGIPIVLAFSTDEPLLTELRDSGAFERIERSPGMRVHLLGGPPDSHTLPVPDQQRQAIAVLLDTLRSVTLAAVAGQPR